MHLLEVEDLKVTFGHGDQRVPAVAGVHLTVDAGETLALVGESGSGKTVTSLSLLGLNPPAPASTTTGRIRYGDRDLTTLSRAEWRRIRGAEIAMVFQDPGAALNPLLTIGTQVSDAVRAHEPMSRTAARQRAVEALELSRLPQPEDMLGRYPHQLSGGMRQRAAIALAIAARPKLLIADEPTTALDVAVQAEILAMLDALRRDLGMGLLLITHDLGVVAGHADRVAVMYAGRVVESGPSSAVLHRPRMPYTRALLDATPRVDGPARQRLAAIPGAPPDLRRAQPGCSFAPRCVHVVDECRTTVPARTLREPGHEAACLRTSLVLAAPRELAVRAPTLTKLPTVRARPMPSAPAEPEPLVTFDDVSLHYPGRGGILRRAPGTRAVDGVTLQVRRGETLALVGESGSGKTSLTRTLLRLERPTGGRVHYDGIDVTRPDRAGLRRLQREVQVVFQNPYASLDPRMRIADILAEPLRTHGEPAGAAELGDLLDAVGMDRSALSLYPRAFSGGQRQRLAIARALALRPQLLVCDEAVSALDVSIQAQVLDLLADLQDRLGMTYLFITHDLAVVRSVADRIAVMRSGRVVEQGPAEKIYAAPAHEYTQSLLALAPGHPGNLDRAIPSSPAQNRISSSWSA
ncbi:ABC transporter ATP-binding protein [Actinoplanes sp. NPDC049118]|uniref:ABC transporter ATP-binding protein n=1 Tax=Actinoplanes sp. NPDC049118 TaxID=3155769 RepID=UPI0033C92BA5